MKNTQQTLELIGVAWFLTALLYFSIKEQSRYPLSTIHFTSVSHLLHEHIQQAMLEDRRFIANSANFNT